MANLELYRTGTRDGADLPVWITKTEGGPPGPRPAVVLVHGGPWVRGASWQWDADAQFLASRGYVVIEPEFRAAPGSALPTSAPAGSNGACACRTTSAMP